METGNIRVGMLVLDHRGTVHGTVERVEAERVSIARRGMSGPEGHWIPVAAIERVDHAVHLYQGASYVGVGAIGGSGTGAAPPPAPGGRPGRMRYLLWVLGLVLLAALAVVAIKVTRGGIGRPAQAVAPGTALPGGQRVEIAPNSLNEEVLQFLASPEPAPRTFTFRTLDFAEENAAVPSGALKGMATLAKILAAYPTARVEVIGYSDVPKNTRAANDIQAAAALGQRRAAAMARALIARGAPAGAITAVSGDDPDYLDSMAPPQAKGNDRHPDLIVTHK